MYVNIYIYMYISHIIYCTYIEYVYIYICIYIHTYINKSHIYHVYIHPTTTGHRGVAGLHIHRGRGRGASDAAAYIHIMSMIHRC